MAAQPVDTDTTAAPAPSRDTMSLGPAGSAAKKNEETQHMDITEEMDDSLDFSEDSAAKQEAQRE